MEKVRLTSSYDTIYLGHLENLLRQAGIFVEKRNQFAAGGLGELSAIDVMPELWVEANVYPRAEVILQQLNAQREQSDDRLRTCPNCGEQVEGQFSQCWQCGHWFEEGE